MKCLGIFTLKHGSICICYDTITSIPLCFSAVGFVNGMVRVLDSITLQDEVSEPFRYARDAITHIEFSHDSKYLATAVSITVEI